MKINWPAKEKTLNIKKEHAKRYLLKYMRELKLHFDMTENEIKDIMKEVYYSKTALYRIIKNARKFLRNKNGN